MVGRDSTGQRTMTRKEEIEKQMDELRSELNAIAAAERVEIEAPVALLEQLGFKCVAKDPVEWTRKVGNLEDTISIYSDLAYLVRDVIGEPGEYKDIAEAYTTQELIDELNSSENWPRWVTYTAEGTFNGTPVTATFETWDDEEGCDLIDRASEALEDVHVDVIGVKKVA